MKLSGRRRDVELRHVDSDVDDLTPSVFMTSNDKDAVILTSLDVVVVNVGFRSGGGLVVHKNGIHILGSQRGGHPPWFPESSLRLRPAFSTGFGLVAYTLPCGST
ncbi:hypothetical protein HPB47_023552 [Ixodes persulcatus]|uniref:Uncharacterized protein n=1 Tax=Ixodes persulcatus TaxID=34615 RepID=A0AC60Q7T7_IXOPE|nr:hypothetical protein HPB47_023552 [Ixodes persulcatus]